MAGEGPSIIEARREQIFPILTAAEINRLRRFGDVQSYAKSEHLLQAGEPIPGMFVILSGEVAVILRDALGHTAPLINYAPGFFMGELGSLSGSPSLVDAEARTQVEALVISTARIRNLTGTRRSIFMRRGTRSSKAMIRPKVVGPHDAAQWPHTPLRLKERSMFKEEIRAGFDAFVHDAGKSFGAVRDVGRGFIVVYVENAGDFTIPLSAVKEVHDEKVVLDCGKLDIDLRRAIGHAHDAERTPYG